MTGEGMAANAAAATVHGIRFPVLSDEPGHFLTALGIPAAQSAAASDGPGTCCYVAIDCGLRIAGRLWCNGTDAAIGAALALCEGLVAPLTAPPPVVTAQAPVLLVPQVLPAAFCRQLIDRWAAADKQEDVASGHYAVAAGEPGNPSVQKPELKRRIDWLIPDGPVHDGIRDLLSRRVAPELRKAFDFQAANYEQLRLGCYDAARGGYFRRHRDNVGPPEIRRRRFAMSLNLNEDYEGGEVRFPEYGPQLYRPPAGGALLFSCSLLHEAMEIRSGRRFVLLTFFFGAAPAKPRNPS
jgi:hypothetical protein